MKVFTEAQTLLLNVRNAMAPSLASLPPELLREIIGSLFDNSDLLNLGLCCRSFYAAILPFLYAHVTFLRARAAEDLRSGPHLHLKELTARFQKEPELASFVQAITFLEGWIKDGEISCNEDQLVVKLLQALPNLKLLDFMSPNFGSDLDSAVFRVAIPKFRLAEGQSLPLQNLRYIACTHSIRSSLPMPPLSAWLQLPSIQQIYVSAFYTKEEPNPDSPTWTRFDCTTSTVKHLHLHECQLSNTDLADILRACMALRTLEYYDVWVEEEVHEQNDLPGLLKALSARRSTLENLCKCTCYYRTSLSHSVSVGPNTVSQLQRTIAVEVLNKSVLI